MNLFALAHSSVVFRNFAVSLKRVKLGVSDTEQKSTSRKTTSYPRFNTSVSVLVKDKKKTMISRTRVRACAVK